MNYPLRSHSLLHENGMNHNYPEYIIVGSQELRRKKMNEFNPSGQAA